MSEKNSTDKKRNWAFVLYPESAPANWKEILQKTGLQCCVSPLHEGELNADNTDKKPHWHVILCYNGPTSYNVVAKLTANLNGTIPQALEQIKGYYRYLTHKDNPEKKQYNEAAIVNINGFSIHDYMEFTKSEIIKLKISIIDYIEENDIREYCDLLLELHRNNLLDMWEIAANNTLFTNSYISSRRYKLKQIEEKQVSEAQKSRKIISTPIKGDESNELAE